MRKRGGRVGEGRGGGEGKGGGGGGEVKEEVKGGVVYLGLMG